MKRGVVTVLSVDGGGVRGLAPALIVEDLMRRVSFLDARVRRRRRWLGGRGVRGRGPGVGALFDLFAGTSTGAMIALGFARKRAVTPAEMTDIYRRQARTIFPVVRFSALRAVRQAFTEKYDKAPFEDLLKTVFGDERLSECPSNVLIASYDTDNRAPYFFKHYSAAVLRHNQALREKDDPPEDFYLRDVARATAAAPTFFEPAKVRSIAGREYSFIDGGMVANNPALSAYVEARKIWRHARRYVIVSIGTGRSGRRFSHDAIKKWGYLDWVSPAHGVPMLSFIMDGQSEAVAHSLKNLPRIEYFRFNFDIENVSEEMDDARPENMARIESAAREVIARHSTDLHRLAKILYREWRRRRGGGTIAR